MQPAIIVISDLHAGRDNPFTFLRTAPLPADLRSEHLELQHLIDSMLPVIEPTPPEERILICAGDLTNACHSEELEKAATFLTHLANALSVQPNHRFVVPGNHDIDWSLTELAETADPWYDNCRQQKFESLLRKAAPTFTMCANGTPERGSCLSGAVEVFMLDSPFDDRSRTKPHHGRLGQSQLQRLESSLRSARPETIKILVVHHHIAPMGRATDPRDFSMLQDARDLQSLFDQYAVHLVIHGHQHRPFVTQLTTAGHETTVLGAGSTTAYEHLPRDMQNTFHVIRIEAASDNPPRISGAIHTRVFSVARGWTPATFSQHGIPARCPFGHYLGHRQLSKLAELAIKHVRKQRFLRLNTFLAERKNCPEAKFIDPHLFSQLIERQLRAQSLEATILITPDHARDDVLLELKDQT